MTPNSVIFLFFPCSTVVLLWSIDLPVSVVCHFAAFVLGKCALPQMCSAEVTMRVDINASVVPQLFEVLKCVSTTLRCQVSRFKRTVSVWCRCCCFLCCQSL